MQAPAGLSPRILPQRGKPTKLGPNGAFHINNAPLCGASQSHGLWPWLITRLPCVVAKRVQAGLIVGLRRVGRDSVLLECILR